MQCRTNEASEVDAGVPLAEFHDHMTALVRALGLHRPDQTPCGRPIAVGEAHALFEVSRGPGLSQSDLATRLQLEKSTVSRIVTLLERRGWIERRREQPDLRVVHLRPTAQGLQAASTLAASRAAKFTRIFQAIPTPERAAVTSALAKLIEVIREA